MKVRKINLSTVLVLMFLVFWVFYGFYSQKQFEGNFEITTGIVKDVAGTWKNGNNLDILYEYNLKGEKKKGEAFYEACGELTSKSLRQLLVGKTFPVAYSTKFTGFRGSDMLITQERANHFKFHCKLPYFSCQSKV